VGLNPVGNHKIDGSPIDSLRRTGGPYPDSSTPLVGIRQFDGGDKPRIGIRGHHPRRRRRFAPI
jgi:hypothetical protein